MSAINRNRQRFALRIVFILALAMIASDLDAQSKDFDFNKDIRPILSDTCFKCHGPDEHERYADLRLDTQAGLDEAAGILGADDVEDSEFLRRIFSDDPDELMPPPDSGRSLSEKQKDLLSRWIAAGAKWEQHWSFVQPEKPSVPQREADVEWCSNEIDAFVMTKLNELKLEPNPIADRSTLIRRVSLDLTGLPPSSEIRARYLNSESLRWYEELVSELMGSPHYGEHMGRYWLDAARYADTHGLHLDNYREMWLYRDWVIDAFNNNQPYDEFVIEQLAGDLLVNPTDSQLIATGFNRAHVTTNEGGSIKEEVLVRNVVDRVSTTGTVFLGLTIACAQCHDHKYDPISQRDFYSMYAFFNSLEANPMDGNQKAHAPVLRLFSDQQKSEMASINLKIGELKKQIDEKIAGFTYEEPTDVNKDVGETEDGPEEVIWVDDMLPVGVKKSGAWKTATAEAVKPKFGSNAYVIQNDQFEQYVITESKNPLRFEKQDRLFAYVYLDPKNPPQQIMLQFNDGGLEHRAYWGENLITFGTDNTPSRLRLGDLPEAGEWVKLE
ncbi:MAG: DUF1549 domain-containing protein, partial [Planctomycetota bacterium]